MRYKNKNKGAAVKLTQDTLLNRITNRIRQSLELQEILSCTVQEMRSFLHTDRVKIYKFHPDGTGQVIAESIYQNRLPSLLGLHFPAGDVPPHAREMFVKARMRSIVDIPQQRITLSCLDDTDTTGDLTVEEVQERPIAEILQRPVDPCHVEYLTSMGVQSSLVVPILHHQQLWGLLVSHHAQSKAFKEQELQLVQKIADQVAVAIAQSHLLTQSREKAAREQLINQIATLLHSPLHIQEILQTVLEIIVDSVQGSGGRLYLTSTGQGSAPELYTYNAQPVDLFNESQMLLEDYPFWQQLMVAAGKEQEIRGKAIADIYQETQLLDVAPLFKPTSIRSLLVMPVQYSGQSLGCLTIFRDEIDTDVVWAGRFDPDERQQRVRDSFAAWRELKKNQAREWTTQEVELVQSLSNHLTMALMQNRLYQYERQQRLLLEMRNQELNIARTVAEEASRLKSGFLSSTSHELRTPLASTLNYLKLLKEGFYDNEEELKEYINVAYQSAENLVALINDVLDLAKIEAGRMMVNWETVKLQPLLEEQCRLFRIESDRRSIPLELECEVDSVYADKVKLRQILTNLLANAFKFTHKGKVSIKVIKRTDTPLVEFFVVDTGIGVDSSKKDLLFEPFVQADGSIKRRYGGTGLGLTVCKHLVELMGGEIWLDSAGLSKGTTVFFTLPSKD